MRKAVPILILAAAMLCAADAPVTVNTVVASVRTGIRKKSKDAEVARALSQLKLSQCLETRILEILESEGAGPQTLGALQQLRDASRLLPFPTEPPPGMAPPPPPSLAEEQRAWQATSAVAAQYNQSLPDFICTRTVHRWVAPAGTEKWTAAPTLEGDLTYFERKESFTLRSVDGKPSTQPITEVGGALSHGEFAQLLAVIFRPESQTDHRWDHWTILRKRPTWVYFFRITANHAPHRLQVGTSTGATAVAAGSRGYLYVDVETNSVTRIVENAEQIPADFLIRQSGVVLDYDYADVGGKRYLLPLRAEASLETTDTRSLNAVEFHAYRKYDANSSVQYQGNIKRP